MLGQGPLIEMPKNDEGVTKTQIEASDVLSSHLAAGAR